MDITHLLQLLALIGVLTLNIMYRRKRSLVVFLRILLCFCVAIVTCTWYFQRFLLIGDIHYHAGHYGSSIRVYQEGLDYLTDRPEVFDYLVGKRTLCERTRRARSRLETEQECDEDAPLDGVEQGCADTSGGKFHGSGPTMRAASGALDDDTLEVGRQGSGEPSAPSTHTGQPTGRSSLPRY